MKECFSEKFTLVVEVKFFFPKIMSTNNQSIRFLNDSELQKVDKIFKYTVFGYIRQQQTEYSSSTIIPQLVIVIILAFYLDDTDEFDEKYCGKYISISNNNKTITYHRKKYWGSNTCYGKKIINSLSNGIYIWKIKFIKGSNDMNIGIDNAKATHCNGNIYENREKGLYALYLEAGYIFSWKKGGYRLDIKRFEKRNDNDTLIMTLHLDSKKSKLCFKWKNSDNNKEFIAFDNILREDGLYYRFAITCREHNQSVQIISE